MVAKTEARAPERPMGPYLSRGYTTEQSNRMKTIGQIKDHPQPTGTYDTQEPVPPAAAHQVETNEKIRRSTQCCRANMDKRPVCMRETKAVVVMEHAAQGGPSARVLGPETLIAKRAPAAAGWVLMAAPRLPQVAKAAAAAEEICRSRLARAWQGQEPRRPQPRHHWNHRHPPMRRGPTQICEAGANATDAQAGSVEESVHGAWEQMQEEEKVQRRDAGPGQWLRQGNRPQAYDRTVAVNAIAVVSRAASMGRMLRKNRDLTVQRGKPDRVAMA